MHLTMRCQVVSTPFIEYDDATLVSRALEATNGKSLRAAGRLLGVSHQQVGDWRKWREAGADSSDLPALKPTTREALSDYLMVAEDLERRRVALRIAASRLDDLADQLREEATSAGGGETAAETAGKIRPEDGGDQKHARGP